MRIILFGLAVWFGCFTTTVLGAGDTPGNAAGSKGSQGSPSLNATQAQPGYSGPVLIRLRFPRGRAGQSEPLVTTGVTGAGDTVYIYYESDTRVGFGFDHWGAGGPLSDPFEINPDQAQEIVLSMGSMLPSPAGSGPDAYATLRRQCLIFLNGKLALKWSGKFYPASQSQISVGVNAIGGSTAGPKFSGVILQVEPIAPEKLPKIPSG